MTARRYVYRLVVDKWPTDDGRPFKDQGYDFWSKVVDGWANGDEECPEWVPDLSGWVCDTGDPYSSNPRPGHRIIDSEPSDYASGYGGHFHYLMNVPAAPGRRFFTRSKVVAMRDTLREWGCEAHVERSRLTEWEVLANA